MTYLYLATFIAGLLLAVRLLFFGAERRRPRARVAFPLRRSEPALVGFLVSFGISGYVILMETSASPLASALYAVAVALPGALLVMWIAIVTAKIQPEHDPDDPRYILQGRVGVVTVSIPVGGEGEIQYEEFGAQPTVRARDIGDDSLEVGEEVCIERVEDGIAHVERWSVVEQRL